MNTPPTGNELLIVVVGLQALLTLVSTAVVIVNGLRRKPPLDQEVYRDFVRMSEMDRLFRSCQSGTCGQIAAMDTRHEKATTEIFAQLRTVDKTIGAQAKSFESSLNGVSKELGNLDGRMGALEKRGVTEELGNLEGRMGALERKGSG